MFTGIIESLGRVKAATAHGGNLQLDIECAFTAELKIDQSVAHNGACLTVVAINDDHFSVTAIEETLQKTNLAQLKQGDLINLERCARVGDRLDGHIVQGHVDQVGECIEKEDLAGSWKFRFRYHPSRQNLVVEKGSICIDGVSLTVVDAREDTFSVAIIPYTFENTAFRQLAVGHKVNLEFDIIGKYLARLSEFSPA